MHNHTSRQKALGHNVGSKVAQTILCLYYFTLALHTRVRCGDARMSDMVELPTQTTQEPFPTTYLQHADASQ